MQETWAALERDAFRIDEPSIDLLGGIAGALASTAPLVIGAATNHIEAGMIAALAGLEVVLGTPSRGPDRARWGLITLAGTIVAVAVGTVLAQRTVVLVAATILAVALTAEMRRAGRSGALSGFAIGAVLVIAGGLPPGEVGPRTLWFAIGGAVGLALTLAAGRVRGAAEGDERDPGSPIPTRRLHAHAARTSIAVGGGLAGARIATLAFGYWVPLTTLAVLQPEAHASWVRMIQRSLGTFVGAAAVAAALVLTDQPTSLIPLVGISSLALFSLRDRSYFWLVLCLTPTALLIVGIGTASGGDVAGDRVVATVLGVTVAAVANMATIAWIRWRRRGQPRPR